MYSDESFVMTLPPIDAERDIVPVVAVTPDYNGDPVATLTVLGQPLVVVQPASGWQVDLVSAFNSDHRQAWVTFYFHLGEIQEEPYLRFGEQVGTDLEQDYFDAVAEETDGHALLAYVGDVCRAVHDRLPDQTPEVSGF